MADRLPASFYYTNFGGVNLKVSDYTLAKTEFLNLRNVDFDVPNALQKRPGSTQSISNNYSGPIIGLFQFDRLNGASWVIAGTDTAMYYIASGGLTSFDTGWSSSQYKDMLTFVNKLWIADGNRFRTWDGGVTYGSLPAGLNCPLTNMEYALTFGTSSTVNSATAVLIGGATAIIRTTSGGTYITYGFYVAYSYLRSDGYQGPVDLSLARNMVLDSGCPYGAEWFSSSIRARYVGITYPASAGVTAINFWVAADTVTNSSTIDPEVNSPAGNLGYRVQNASSGWNILSFTLKPSADLTRFRFWGSVNPSNLFTAPVSFSTFGSSIGWATTMAPIVAAIGTGFSIGRWLNDYQNELPFSGMPFCWYDTNTPKYIDTNQNVMFMSGFSNTPSTIWFTDVGAPESIDPTYNFEVRTNDGDRIIGHRTYNGNVIVFKTTSFHKVVGTTPDDFQLVELSLEFGAVSNQAIIEYNEKLVWLDRKGIIQFDGASWRVISDDIDDIFRSMNLSAAYEKAVAVHHLYRNQIWFGIPVNGSTENNLTVVWDYLLDAWTFFDGFNPSSFSFIQSSLSTPTVWRGDYSGMIYYHGESFFGDNGQGITCLTFSRFEQFQGENSTNVWRRLFLDVAPASGLTGTITGQVYTDYNQSTVMATFSMYQTIFQNKAEMGVVGKAVAFEVSHHSASLPFLMNGYTWVKRYLRNV